MSDFDKYIRQGEPERKEKAHAWQAAIGLPRVDGLKPSEYLQQTAGRHIAGEYLKDNPNTTQTEVAVHIGKSPRTVKRMTPSLIERGLLEQENGKRNGKWVVRNINLNR